MKKSILIIAAFVALAMLASCQKEQFTENVAPVTGVTEFTATIEQPTKTVIAADGKITWKAGDEITVTDAASNSAVYVAGADGASTTFTLKTGETAVGEGPYTATYGDIANQIYSAEGANYPLAAPATSTTVFKFSSPYAVVKITAKSEGEEVIDSVGVSYGEKIYTLNCGEGVTLTSDGIDFFVAVETATDASLSVTFHTADKTATKERTSAVTLAAKDLLPVTLTFAEGDWESTEADTPEPLKGVFTVSDSGTPGDPSDDVKVHFSRGNLYCSRTSSESSDWGWHFYEKQHQFKSDYPIKEETEMRFATDGDTAIDLFTWGYSSSTSLSPTGKNYVTGHNGDDDKLVYDKPSSEGGDDWGVAYCESNDIPVGTWRTLTTLEWRYLVDTKRMKNVDFSYSDYTGGVYIENTYYKGVFFYPDNYIGEEVSSSMTWNAINAAGIVFLPAAGHRQDGSDLGSPGGLICFYWSASSCNDKEKAYDVFFRGYDIGTYYTKPRSYGHSVRLVTNVSATPAPEEVATDLSSSETANCYIVNAAGVYKFKAVKGNSNESVGTPKSAEVLWESYGTSTAPNVKDLVSKVSLENGYVKFTAMDKKGNAVIAVKDENKNILWSWHIWLTDEPEDQVYANDAGTMMDRNLGATSNNGSDEDNKLASFGLLYQWGRKDPFLGGDGVKSTTRAASTLSWPEAEGGHKTVDWAIQNPTTFITSSENPLDWTNPRNDELWKSDKTIYDPCPSGYRVPDGGDGGVWKTAGFSNETRGKFVDGFNFSTLSGGGTTWYPAANRRSRENGTLSQWPTGNYWSCSSNDKMQADLLHFRDVEVKSVDSFGRACGHSVRCQKIVEE